MRTNRELKYFLGIPLTADIEQVEIVNEVRNSYFRNTPRFYTFVNANSYYVASKNDEYQNLLKEFDGIFSDGIVVAVGHRLLIGPCSRHSFDSTSLAPPVFEFAHEVNAPIFFIGAHGDTVKKAVEEVKKKYRNIDVVGVASGFPKNLEQQAKEIIKSGAKIVICGMGAPHQEKFLILLKKYGFQGICFSCGGYFDQLLGGLHYYPRWINKFNLRFLYRIYREPGRLIKRYFFDSRFFFIRFSKAVVFRRQRAS